MSSSAQPLIFHMSTTVLLGQALSAMPCGSLLHILQRKPASILGALCAPVSLADRIEQCLPDVSLRAFPAMLGTHAQKNLGQAFPTVKRGGLLQWSQVRGFVLLDALQTPTAPAYTCVLPLPDMASGATPGIALLARHELWREKLTSARLRQASSVLDIQPPFRALAPAPVAPGPSLQHLYGHRLPGVPFGAAEQVFEVLPTKDSGQAFPSPLLRVLLQARQSLARNSLQGPSPAYTKRTHAIANGGVIVSHPLMARLMQAAKAIMAVLPVPLLVQAHTAILSRLAMQTLHSRRLTAQTATANRHQVIGRVTQYMPLAALESIERLAVHPLAIQRDEAQLFQLASDERWAIESVRVHFRAPTA